MRGRLKGWRAVGAGAALAALLAAGSVSADVAALQGHGGPVRALAVGPDGAVLTGSFDTRAILWDGGSGAARAVMQLHEGSVTALAFLPDGRVATAGQEGRIAFWQPGAREPEIVVAAHQGPVTALALSPDGRLLAASAWDGTASLREVAAPEAALAVLDGHGDNVNGVGFLPDGRIVTAAYDGVLRFWEADGAAALAVSLGVPLNALAVAEGGAVFAAGADGGLRAFDAAGAPLGEVAAGAGPLVSLAAAGGLVAAGGLDGSVALVDAGSLALVRQVVVSSGPVWSVGLAEGGAALVASGADDVVRVWDTATGAPLAGEERLAGAGGQEAAHGNGHGAQVFRMCAACHTLGPDDGNRAGPTLHGIFGRPIASAEGFRYSEALRGMDIVWTPETVARLFEIGPEAMTPGTTMPEQRIADPEDREALIAFLKRHTR